MKCLGNCCRARTRRCHSRKAATGWSCMATSEPAAPAVQAELSALPAPAWHAPWPQAGAAIFSTDLAVGDASAEFEVPPPADGEAGDRRYRLTLSHLGTADLALTGVDLRREAPAVDAARTSSYLAGRKKLVLIGNCQCSVLCQAFNQADSLNRNFITKYHFVQLRPNLYEFARRDIEECDVLLVQDIGMWNQFPLQRLHSARHRDRQVSAGAVRLAMAVRRVERAGRPRRLRARGAEPDRSRISTGCSAGCAARSPTRRRAFSAYRALDGAGHRQLPPAARDRGTPPAADRQEITIAAIGDFILENFRTRRVFHTTVRPNWRGVQPADAVRSLKAMGVARRRSADGERRCDRCATRKCRSIPRSRGSRGRVGRRRRTRYLSRGRDDLGSLYPQLYRALRVSAGRETAMSLRDRIGIDIGRKLPLEDAVAWAAAHAVSAISTSSSTPAPTRSARSTMRRGAAVRAACERHGMHLGLHTSSAVNVAEYAPYVADAVERYLEAYVDAVGAARRRVDRHACRVSFHLRHRAAHAGRAASGCSALVAYAERKGALVLLENLNKEPADAEVHYLAHTVEEWRYYFDAHRVAGLPAVVHGQPRASGARGRSPGLSRRSTCAGSHEVRLADCFRNGHEVHLKPGDGDLDFADMFRRIEGEGLSRPLHERLRLARRHAGRPRRAGTAGRHRRGLTALRIKPPDKRARPAVGGSAAAATAAGSTPTSTQVASRSSSASSAACRVSSAISRIRRN